MRRYISSIFILSVAIGIFILRFDPRSVFVEGIVGQPGNLNPASRSVNSVDDMLESLLFRSLFSYDRSGEIVPDLAESYSVGSGEKIYEIKIKEDAFWHDGTPVTAEDVAFTFASDPTFAKVAVQAVAEKTVQFELENPLASFLSILTRPVAPARLGSQSGFPAVGSGDFKVRQVTKNGIVTSLVLEAVDSAADTKEIVFKFFQSQAELEDAARRGEVDAFVGNNFAHPSFTKYDVPLYGQYFAIFFNLRSGNDLVKDANFRKSASEKVPIDTLIDEALEGEGSPVRGPLSGTWAEADLPFPQFSPSLKGGYTGQLVITVPNVGKLPEVAELVAESWRELGVEVGVVFIDPAEVNNLVESKNFEAVILGQEVDRDPDRYGLWHSTQKDYPGLNIVAYADPRADRALEEGRKTSDRDKRKTHYLHFQQLFLEDNPAIFLYHPNLSYFVSRKFSGIDLTNVFVPANRLWNIQEWRKL